MSEVTSTTDDGDYRATTSQPSASPVSAHIPRSEPANHRWLVAFLVIATIALVLGMGMIMVVNAGLVTLD